MTKYIYKTVRKPFFVLTEEWLNNFGSDGWVLCGRRDLNQYIFIKELATPTKTDKQ